MSSNPEMRYNLRSRHNTSNDNRIQQQDGGDRDARSSRRGPRRTAFTGDANVQLRAGSPLAQVRDLAGQLVRDTQAASSSRLSESPPVEIDKQVVLNTYFRSNDTRPNAILALGKELIDRAYQNTGKPVPPITDEQYTLIRDQFIKVEGIPPGRIESALEFAQKGREQGQRLQEQLKKQRYEAFERLRDTTTIKSTLTEIKRYAGFLKSSVMNYPFIINGAMDIERVQKIMSHLGGRTFPGDKWGEQSEPKSSTTDKIGLLNELLETKKDHLTFPNACKMHDAIDKLRDMLDREHT